MKTKDFSTIAVTAFGTATLVVATFLGGTLEAVDDASPPGPALAKPEMIAKGIKMTLTAAEGHELKAGDAPEFDLLAENTLSEPAEAHISLTMTATAPNSAFSRMVVMPSVLWRQEWTLMLEPNETRSVKFNTHTNLPANSLITVSLYPVDQSKSASPGNLTTGSSAGIQPLPVPIIQQGIAVLNFSTVQNPATLASVPVPPRSK
jgi:hypothetical protein